jgi:hypothetical protein
VKIFRQKRGKQLLKPTPSQKFLKEIRRFGDTQKARSKKRRGILGKIGGNWGKNEHGAQGGPFLKYPECRLLRKRKKVKAKAK